MFKQIFPDAEITPSGEAFINGVPVAILARQESPLRATTSDPQDSFEETAHGASGSKPDLRTSFQHGQNLLPLVISELNCHHAEQFSFFTSTQP